MLALVMTNDNKLKRRTAHPAIPALGLWKDEDDLSDLESKS
jgi:hypothetical protein